MRKTYISDALKDLLSTPEGRKLFADSMREYLNRPLKKLKPIDWSKVDFRCKI